MPIEQAQCFQNEQCVKTKQIEKKHLESTVLSVKNCGKIIHMTASSLLAS